MEGTYAVLSNFNFLEPKIFDVLASYFKNEGVTAIILNGDFSGSDYVSQSHKWLKKRSKFAIKMKGVRKKLEPVELSLDHFDLPVLKQERKTMSSKEVRGYSHQDYMFQVLNSFGASNLEVFVNPGLTERVSEYEEVMSLLSAKYPNLVDTVKNPVIKKKSHELVFVPGLLPDHEERGTFFIDKTYHSRKVQVNQEKKYFFGVQSISDMVTDPENSLLFTSEPPSFKSNKAIDFLTNYVLLEDFFVFDECTKQNTLFSKGTLIYKEDLFDFLESGALIEEVFENIGDPFFNLIYQSAGFNKIFVNFPDNVGVAHDWKEKICLRPDFQKEIICVPSDIDNLLAGLLEVKKAKCAYYCFDFNEIIYSC